MSFTRPFLLALCSFGTPSRALVVITWRGVGYRYMMRMGQTVKREQILNTKEQMSSIWAKGCRLMIVCVLSDLQWLPLLGGGRKSMCIIIIFTFLSRFFSCQNDLLFFNILNCFLNHIIKLSVFLCFLSNYTHAHRETQ